MGIFCEHRLPTTWHVKETRGQQIIVHGISISANISPPIISLEIEKGVIWTPQKMVCQEDNQQMAQLLDLPFELLSTHTSSCDDTRDLARASAICKDFKTLATQGDVLKVVNFQNMRVFDCCELHHHIDGLLSGCVRAGNLTAECKLAEAILKGGTPLWRKILVNVPQQSSIIYAPGLHCLSAVTFPNL